MPKYSKLKSARLAGSRLSKPTSNAVASHARVRKAPSRATAVWSVLLGALTIVGGLMYASGEFQQRESMQATSVARVDDAPLAPVWSSIVIHASGTPAASVQSLDRSSQAMGLDSMPYHFVIGNGLDAADGSVSAGQRWHNQRTGVQTATRPEGSQPDSAWFDAHAVSICLAGNGDRRPFSAAQIEALVRAVQELQRAYGIADTAVFLHSDLSAVSDPGSYFPRELFFSALGN